MSDMIRALCWDFDGVIVDSDEYNQVTLALTAQEVGIPFQRQDFSTHFAGRNLRDGATSYLRALGNAGLVDVFAAAKARFDYLYMDLATPYKDALDCISHLAGRLPMALVTGSRIVLVEQFFSTQPQIRGAFSVWITAEDTPPGCGKPNPEPYRRALSALRVDASAALAVEDSAAGVAAAQRAGMQCLAVRRLGTTDELVASRVVSSLSPAAMIELVCHGLPASRSGAPN